MGLTSRPLEVHSRRRHKVCICSVILGELESLRNYKGLEYIPENFGCKLETFKNIFIFSDSDLRQIFEFEAIHVVVRYPEVVMARTVYCY